MITHANAAGGVKEISNNKIAKQFYMTQPRRYPKGNAPTITSGDGDEYENNR